MCPPNHIAHASRLLAENWATAHTFMNPHCPGINVIECGDHYHIGHANRKMKSQCLNNNQAYSKRGVKIDVRYRKD